MTDHVVYKKVYKNGSIYAGSDGKVYKSGRGKAGFSEIEPVETDGKPSVTIKRKGESVIYFVAKLVALAFSERYRQNPNAYLIGRKDNDVFNTKPTNLLFLRKNKCIKRSF